MKRRIIFKDNITAFNFPFLLEDFSPWKKQCEDKIAEMKSEYSVRKSARWGYTIQDGHASIQIYKH